MIYIFSKHFNHLGIVTCLVLSLARLYSQDLIPYLDNGLYGYADLSGKVLIKPQFGEVTWFDSTRMADVRYGSHWSVINEAGNVLLPFEASQPVTFTRAYNKPYHGSYNNYQPEDTLRYLQVIHLDSLHFRFFNSSNGRFSSIFTRTEYMLVLDNEIHISFTNGIFPGILSDKTFEIIDTNFTTLLKTQEDPRILNSHLISVKDNNSILLFDYHTLQKTKLPFLEVHQAVKDSFLIVSDTSKYRKTNYRWIKPAMGLSDLKGNLVLPIEYLQLNYKAGNLLIEYIPDKGNRFLNFKGIPVDTTIYTGANFQCDSVYIATNYARKHLVLDLQGRPLTKAYDKLKQNWNCKSFQFNDGPFAGIMDSNFIETIRIEADEVFYPFGNDLFTFQKNSKYGILNPAGKIILPPIYDQFHYLNNDYNKVSINNKFGLIRKDGKIIFEAVYDDVGGFGTPRGTYYTTRLNNLSTLYDDQFNIIEDSISGDVHLRKVNITRRNGLTFLTDSRGILITEPTKKYNAAWVYSDTNMIHILTRDNYLEIINEDGKIITNDSIRLENDPNKRSYAGGLFAVRVGEQEGVINHKGKWILQPGSQEVLAITQSLIVARKKNKHALYNAQGAPIPSESFTHIDIDKGEKFWRVKLNNKYGYLNSLTGKLAVPAVYDQTMKFDDYLTVATSGQKDGNKTTMLVDTSGNVILKTDYDTLYALDEIESYRHYVAIEHGKKGIINLAGDIIIPFQYDQLNSFADTTFFVTSTSGNGMQLLNRKNKVVFSGTQFPDKNYIRLPGHNYLFTMHGNTVIVDSDGKTIKTLPGTSFIKIPAGGEQIKFLQGMDKDHSYLINAETLVEYRNQ